jgi:hypothetical protein
MKHMYYIKGDKISKATLRAMLEQIGETVKRDGGVYVTLHNNKTQPKPKRKPWRKSTNAQERVLRAITGFKTRDEMTKTEQKTHDLVDLITS